LFHEIFRIWTFLNWKKKKKIIVDFLQDQVTLIKVKIKWFSFEHNLKEKKNQMNFQLNYLKKRYTAFFFLHFDHCLFFTLVSQEIYCFYQLDLKIRFLLLFCWKWRASRKKTVQKIGTTMMGNRSFSYTVNIKVFRNPVRKSTIGNFIPTLLEKVFFFSFGFRSST
jgi:hypothetical protein